MRGCCGGTSIECCVRTLAAECTYTGVSRVTGHFILSGSWLSCSPGTTCTQTGCRNIINSSKFLFSSTQCMGPSPVVCLPPLLKDMPISIPTVQVVPSVTHADLDRLLGFRC